MGGEAAPRGFFDLKKQFIFYASYHNHPVNIAIHLFCIWNLVWSGLALFHHAPVFMEPPAALNNIPQIKSFNQLDAIAKFLTRLQGQAKEAIGELDIGADSTLKSVTDKLRLIYGHPIKVLRQIRH